MRRGRGEEAWGFLKPRSIVRSLLGAPIYDVCENFSLGGFGATRARRGHHGEGRAGACLDDDFGPLRQWVLRWRSDPIITLRRALDGGDGATHRCLPSRSASSGGAA